MRCPFCDFSDTQVKDSRPTDDGGSIKRRRQCPSCGARFTTFERTESREIKVKKRNGEIRLFDMNKLTRSIEIAIRKRPINTDKLDKITSIIMKKLDRYGEGEVESKVIGQLVMEELAKLDAVACVRYASVYKDFSDSADFAKFIENLDKQSSNAA
jgi:transcriptional repressor NrdR